MTSTTPSRLLAGWSRITAWLAESAPGSAGSIAPADLGASARARAELGELLTEPLREWWSLHGGVIDPVPGQLLGGYAPYPVAQALEVRRVLVSERPDTTAAVVPFARNLSGDDLVVEAPTGAVCLHGRESGLGPPLTASLADLLDDVGTALHDRAPWRGRIPVVEDGLLWWRLPTGVAGSARSRT